MLSGQITSDQARRLAASVVMKTKIGTKNSQYGSKWFNDGKKEKKIRLSEFPPKGWESGRIKKPPHRDGEIPWNKGKSDYITDEIRKSFGNGWRGKSRPDQAERMIGTSYHRGHFHSEETKKIMSIKKLGNKNRKKK